jgi:hypothetical protein
MVHIRFRKDRVIPEKSMSKLRKADIERKQSPSYIQPRSFGDKEAKERKERSVPKNDPYHKQPTKHRKETHSTTSPCVTSEVYQEASGQKIPAHRKKPTLPLRHFEPSVPVLQISIVGMMSFGQRCQWCSRSIGCLVRAVGSSVLPSWAHPHPSHCRRSNYALYMFLGRDPIRSMRLLRCLCQL